jgi:hypothetical protein
MLSALARAMRHPAVAVLAIAGAVDVLTGDPAAHGLALVAVAAMLFVEGLRERRGSSTEIAGERWRFRMIPGMVAVGLVYAIVAGAFQRFSWPLTIAILAPGVWAVSFAWRGTPDVAPEPAAVEPIGLAAWAAVFLALAAWEVQALLLQPTLTTSSWAHPTLSTLMDSVLVSHVGRSISVAVWLLLGGWLLER